MHIGSFVTLLQWWTKILSKLGEYDEIPFRGGFHLGGEIWLYLYTGTGGKWGNLERHSQMVGKVKRSPVISGLCVACFADNRHGHNNFDNVDCNTHQSDVLIESFRLVKISRKSDKYCRSCFLRSRHHHDDNNFHIADYNTYQCLVLIESSRLVKVSLKSDEYCRRWFLRGRRYLKPQR